MSRGKVPTPIHIEATGEAVTRKGSVRSGVEKREAERAAWTERTASRPPNALVTLGKGR